MATRDWVEIILAVLVAGTLIVLSLSVAYVLRRIGSLSSHLEQAVDQMQNDRSAVVLKLHESLGKFTELSDTLTELLRSEVGPTVEVTRSAMEHVETTLKGAADATAAVRRLAAGAEALAAPSAVAAAMERVTGSPAGRIALLGAGLMALVRGVFRGRGRKTKPSQQEGKHGHE